MTIFDENLPPAQDLKALINEEHRWVELKRLRMGMEGCGCAECQALYKTLELSVYDTRVIQYGDLIFIRAGRSGTDLIDNSPGDYWTDDSIQFVHFNKGYGISPALQTVCTGLLNAGSRPLEPSPDGDEASQDGKDDVSKIKDEGNIVGTEKSGIMKRRGRPKKIGSDISRVTEWRRRKERELQGVLL